LKKLCRDILSDIFHFCVEIKMNCEEKSMEAKVGDKLSEDQALMKIKIQRLEKEDFFVSISKKGLIAHLKEKIITFLNAAQLGNEDTQSCVGNLRLIYKGKVLLDPKSVEFYKIQNDDTIQLCPTRRRRIGHPSPAGGPNVSTQTQVVDALPFVREGGEFTYISFSMSDPPEVGRGGSGLMPLSRSRSRGQNILNNSEAYSSAPRSRRSIRRRQTQPTRGRPTPATVTETLRNFKFILRETLRCISETNADNTQELLPQLNVLIRQATSLRNDIQIERPAPPPFTSRVEVLLFERLGAASRSRLTGTEEKEDAPRARGRTEPDVPNPNTRIPHPGPETVQTRSIDIDAERRMVPAMRLLPQRFNVGAAFQLSVASNNFGENAVVPPDFMTETGTAQASNREEQPNSTESREEVSPPQRTRSRNIFSNLINRISRRWV